MSDSERQSFVDRLLSDRPEPAVEWIAARRDAAAARAGTLSMPTRKHEEWRFFSLRAIAGTAWERPSGFETDPYLVEDFAPEMNTAASLVFVNGRYAPDLSDPVADGALYAGSLSGLDDEEQGVVSDTLGSCVAHYEDDVFTQLATANFEDAACVVVAPDTALDRPIELVFVTDATGPEASFPRAVVVAGRGSKFTLLERYVGAGEQGYFVSPVTEVHVADSANVDHVRIQQDAPTARHVARLGVRLAAHAQYDSISVTLGAASSRTDVYMVHEGVEGFGRIDGLALLRDRQESDTHSVIDNTKPRCNSHQLHKCVVDDRSHAVFNGKIFVRKGAQLIDAYQLNRNLLLSAGARVDTKPQLEIFADDVQCTHGATVGQLDDEQLFYLTSRGIEPDEARSILTYGFAAEIVDMIPIDPVRKQLEAEVLRLTRPSEAS